ncbi:MAG: 4-hydroxy-tetrahydrodipicolinate synthase [Hungatella sp.]|jgi:4-hydroxy-tetrahydrodipicolinate synthase|nr:4-hydroxy-tetrahydrodipicolinate synthase [Hungatella sp.]
MAIFEGAGVALVTPFDHKGEVNFPKLSELIEEQIAGGTDAIISCGTTGESSTMSHEEHVEVIRYTCEAVKGRIPVIAGTGSNCTKEAIHLSKEAEKAGADGLLLVTPYYNKATQNGLITHYKAIAEAVNIPILLYHIPGRTGVTMKPETIVTLCREVPNIVGVKEASGNFSSIATMMHLADGCVDLYSGNDDQIVPLLAMGGKGVISVLSNVAPRQTHDICQSFFDGDVKRSLELQLKAVPLITQLFCEVNPIPVKTAMNLMGKEVGPLRLPLTEMEAANQKNLAAAMKEYGI